MKSAADWLHPLCPLLFALSSREAGRARHSRRSVEPAIHRLGTTKEVRTPHIDRIAREGMIFDACYVTSPVCMPARVSLLTGLYPHNAGHGLWGNAAGYFPRPEDAPMFLDIQRAGWTTAQIGKTHWTAGPAWQERFKNSGAFFKALGLDHVADIPGPPDSVNGRDLYSQHLRQHELLQAVADDLRGRYVKGEFEPRASVVKVEDYHDVFTTGLAVDLIRLGNRRRSRSASSSACTRRTRRWMRRALTPRCSIPRRSRCRPPVPAEISA